MTNKCILSTQATTPDTSRLTLVVPPTAPPVTTRTLPYIINMTTFIPFSPIIILTRQT